MKTEKSQKFNLRAINDIVIVLEDPMDFMADAESGLNSDVTKALKSGLLVTPEKYESFAQKFPCRGKVISVGQKCESEIKVGDRIIFARLGCQRYREGEKTMVIVRECDIHGIFNDD